VDLIAYPKRLAHTHGYAATQDSYLAKGHNATLTVTPYEHQPAFWSRQRWFSASQRKIDALRPLIATSKIRCLEIRRRKGED
jgi:hypothetical protein